MRYLLDTNIISNFTKPAPSSSLIAWMREQVDADLFIALIWAELMAMGTANGRPRGPLDTIIAAVALANDCVVVTDNQKDFDGLEMLNPIRG